MTMMQRKGAWSAMTNISDRDIAISLLRSAGHGNVLDRNVDLILNSKIKIDLDGNIVELALGTKDRYSTRFQQHQHQHHHQQRRRRQRRRWRPAESNNNIDDDDDVTSHWDLSESVGKLRKLNKLVLYRCRSLPTTLNELPKLKCLQLHFCDGDTMLQMQQPLNSLTRLKGSHGISGGTDFRLVNLKTLEIHDGSWSAQSIFWMKRMTATSADIVTSDEHNEEHSSKETQIISQLESVRFSFLQNDLRNAILDFLSPFKATEPKNNNGRANVSERAKTTARSCALPISKLKRLAWVHSGLTAQGLQLLLRAVVLPYHPSVISIDVSGNQIRSLQFLLELGDIAMYPSLSISDVKTNESSKGHNRTNNDNGQLQLRQHRNQTYHSLRTLNLQHNPVLRHRISHRYEQEAFEMLLQRYFPLLGSLTPSWENWDAGIEYLLRINRGGRVLVEGNVIPPSLLASMKLRSNGGGTSTKEDQALITAATIATTRIKETGAPKKLAKKTIHLSVWPLVLHRAYKTSPKGFLPPLEDATAMYFLIRNGPALSEVFSAATR